MWETHLLLVHYLHIGNPVQLNECVLTLKFDVKPIQFYFKIEVSQPVYIHDCYDFE